MKPSGLADRPTLETRRWLEDIVVGHNLCPFAARPLRDHKVHIAQSAATTEEQLIVDLGVEISRLLADDNVETTLLIHPDVLHNFTQYNQFLEVADTVLAKLHVEGRLQIASFHPDYCFADSPTEDPANYTNRAPYPMLHLLRESSIEAAVERHGDTESIPIRNVEYLRSLAPDDFAAAFKKPGD